MTLLEGFLLVIIGVLGFRLYMHRRYLHRMLNWISGPLDAPVPNAFGIWGEFVSRMNRRVKTRQQEKDLLEQSLEQFQSALEALPDGVIFMDAHRRILWMNSLAVDMMRLIPGQDRGTPIEHLVREPEFAAYLQRGDFSEPLMYHPNRRDQASYMISLISYGVDRSLLAIRDLTRIEKLENVRRDFVANVSHELKTPLTVINGFIETLQMHHESLSTEKRQRYLDLALSQSHQMGRLIQDLLTLSSLEARANLSDQTRVPVKALVDELVVSAEAISDGKHTLSIDVPPDLSILGSAMALRSIFGNLINNAVNYTPADGSITISWRETERKGIFSVQDTGIGIPEIHLPRISERFYRVDQGRSRETGGTGLGLAIVKHALSRHQGHLEIKSQINQGSTFEACFPKERFSRV
ncbi:MAG: Phosphate regulon sensor protein PhoR [Fluviibacter phosphoraccumulans EoVTN8]